MAIKGGTPVPKVIDFGIAKAIGVEVDPASAAAERGAGPPAMTLSPPLLGTPHYMSPEQAKFPAGHADWRSDVYSLGALLYELLTDQPPFDLAMLRTAAFGEIARILQNVEPTLPSDRLASTPSEPAAPGTPNSQASGRASLVRGNLDRIVTKAMQKDPSRRYESAEALASDIRRHLDGRPISPASQTKRRPPSGISGPRRRMAALVVAAFVIAVACTVGYLVWRQTIPALHSPSAAADGEMEAPGLTATYFAGMGFDDPVGSRIDSTIDFAWPRGAAPMPGIHPPRYSVRWRGTLWVPPAGIIAIGVQADDGARLSIDGVPLLAFRKPATLYASITLSPGRHQLQLDYWNRLAEGSVTLLWVRRGTSAGEPVPASALFHAIGSDPETQPATTAPASSRFQ